MSQHLFRALGREILRIGVPDRVKELLYRGLAATMPDHMRMRYGAPSMEWSLRRMRALGFAPRHIVDCGAYEGHWTAMARRVFPSADILMIEALQAKRPALERAARSSPRIRYRHAVLGAETGRSITFYELETGSSVLYERSDVPRQATTRRTETLDDIVTEMEAGPVDLLKLDVQGYEIEVLRGGQRTLGAVGAALLEVSFLPVNEGAPPLHDVITFLHERDFVAYDICGYNRRAADGALCQVDIVFVREDSPLREDTRFH